MCPYEKLNYTNHPKLQVRAARLESNSFHMLIGA